MQPAGLPRAAGRTRSRDADLRAFYERLLARARATRVFRSGEWQLGERSGWEGNDTWQNLVAWGWRGDGRASSSS